MTQSGCGPVRLFHKLHIPANCNFALAPIVLVHGVCTTHENWMDVAPKLGERTQRKVIMIDNRNHGDSEWTKENNLDLMIQDLELLLSNLDYKKYVIIGHSLGGRIACGYTLKVPSKVELLIIEDSTLSKQYKYFAFADTFKSLVKMIEFIPKSYGEKEIQNMIGKYLKSIMPDLPIEGISCFLPLYKDDKGKIQFRFNAAALEESSCDESGYLLDLQKCTIYDGPALFLHGENSPVPTHEDETIPIYFPKAEIVDVPKSVHTPHLESAKEFLEIVCDFINKNTEISPKCN